MWLKIQILVSYKKRPFFLKKNLISIDGCSNKFKYSKI
jgi:hypothetical protein